MKALVFLGVILCTINTYAQFDTDHVDHAGGVTNPSDFSWYYYVDQMNRFPERIGAICYNAYIVEKAGLHNQAIQFYRECANRGSSSAMIQMSIFYDEGVGVERNPTIATNWLKRAAMAGNVMAQRHYAQRLIDDEGVEQNETLGNQWLQQTGGVR